MLRGSELRALGELREPTTVSELAERLGWSRSHTSEVADALSGKGLVRKERDGKAKRVIPTESKSVELYHDVTQQFSHIDLPELLAGPTIPLLYYLDDPITVADLADQTDNYRNTVHRRVKRLLERGIVGETDSRYVLNEDFRILHSFAEEYVHHVHRQIIGNVAEASSILWEDHRSFLLRTDEPVRDESFVSTGPERFEDFGLPLLTRDARYYFYPADLIDLTPEELICHTLVIDDGTRFRSYCLLLLLACDDIDEERLSELSTRYDVEKSVEELQAYLRSRGDETVPELPSWMEFVELAEDYEVSE